MLCQRLAVKITKTERYWIAISLCRFVGKKQDYYFCIIDCSVYFDSPPSLPFSLSLSLRLYEEAEGQEPIILTKRRKEEVLRRSPIHRLVEKTDKTVDRTDTAGTVEYEWTFGGCTRYGFELWCKVSRIWRGESKREIYTYIYINERKKGKRYERIVKEGRGKKKENPRAWKKGWRRKGEEIGGTVRWKNVIERS